LVHSPASSAPSLVRTSPVASSRCTNSLTAATRGLPRRPHAPTP
jgi:hypothetical protein